MNVVGCGEHNEGSHHRKRPGRRLWRLHRATEGLAGSRRGRSPRGVRGKRRHPKDLRRTGRLNQAGIDVEAAERNGQLELLPWEQAHVVDGYFDQHRMLANLDRRFAEDNERYEATRLWSNQEWALQDLPDVMDIIEYESRFNLIWPKYQDITVCVYDATKFSAEVMMGVMRTHPLVIVDSVARPNPFYVPPEELLKELRGYKPARLGT
jgi:hypothetical protein